MSFRGSANTLQRRESGGSLKQRSDGSIQPVSINSNGDDIDKSISQGRQNVNSGQDSVSGSARKSKPASLVTDARQILEIDNGRHSRQRSAKSGGGSVSYQSNRYENSHIMSDNISTGHNHTMHDLVADKFYRGRTETTPRNEDEIKAMSKRLEDFLDQMMKERQVQLTARGNHNNNNNNNINNDLNSNNSNKSNNKSAKRPHVDRSTSSHKLNENTRSPINVLLQRISQRIVPEQLQEVVPGGNNQEMFLGGNTTDSALPRRSSVRRRPSIDVRPLTVRQISRPFLFGLSLKSREDMLSGNDAKEKDKNDVKHEHKQVIMYNAWLDFASPDWRTEEKRMEYLSFKRSDSNIILKIVVFVLLSIFGGTLVLVHYTVHPSPPVQDTFIISLVFALIALISGIFTICIHFLLLSTWYHFDIPCISWLQSFQQSILDSRLPQMAEDMVLFFFQLTASTFLLGTSLELKRKNEVENLVCPAVELPPDLVCIAMSIVLLVQIFSKGSSKTSLVFSWITSIIFTNVCLYLVNSTLYFWINATYFFLLAISYELERLTLRHFIKSVMAVEIIEYNAELQLELANQQIREGEQSLQAKRTIVRHVGHEIRTPLNTIAIGGDILAQELAAVQPPLSASTIEIVTSIQEASASALETVNELLCFEKISAGMKTIEPTNQLLLPFIRDSMKSHMLPALAKNIDFELVCVETHDRSMIVFIDPVKFRIVFRNLFTNAIKFSPTNGRIEVKVELMRGSPSVSTGMPLIRTSTINAKSVLLVSKRGSNCTNSNRIPNNNDNHNNTRPLRSGNSKEFSNNKATGAVDTSTACGGGGGNQSGHDGVGNDTNGGIGGTTNAWGGNDFVIISCKDSGAGLSKENLSQLFREGVQFKANELQGGGGSGLGLFITKGIVEQHEEGKIWAESEGEGMGCTFFVKLPVVYREQMEPQQSTTVVGSSSPTNHLTITSNQSTIRGDGGIGGGIFDSNVSVDCQAGGGGVDATHGNDTTGALGVGKVDTTGNKSHLHIPPLHNTNSATLLDGDIRSSVSPECSIAPSINEINRPIGGGQTRSGSGGCGTMGVDLQPTPSGTQPGQGLGPLNILVVDDSPANRKMVVRMLKLDGHRCVEAIDGLAAVGAVSRSMIRRLSGEEMPEFDVILMDKNMPKMSGPDAAREMRRIGRLKPIIGITGSDDNVEFIQAGANLVLLKPINRVSLTEAIRSVIDKKHSKWNSEKSNDHDGNNHNTGVTTNETQLLSVPGQGQGHSEHNDALHHHKSQINSDIGLSPILSQALAIAKGDNHDLITSQKQPDSTTNGVEVTSSTSLEDTHRILCHDSNVRALLSERNDQPEDEIQSFRQAETTRLQQNSHIYNDNNPPAMPTLHEDARSHCSTGDNAVNSRHMSAHSMENRNDVANHSMFNDSV